MSYKIAVASTNGEEVNQHFGWAEYFYIYEINEKEIKCIEKRDVIENEQSNPKENSGCCVKASSKVETVKDCRAVVAVNIGFNVQKLLSQYKISVFAGVEESIDNALQKISEYFYKSDNHLNIKKSID